MNDMRANMGDPFDRSVFEALDSMRFDDEAERRIWEQLKSEVAAQGAPRPALRRRKIIAGGLALAMAASVSAVAISVTAAQQPTELVTPSRVEPAATEPNDVASATSAETAQIVSDAQGATAAAPDWSIAVSDGFSLIMRTTQDGGFVVSKGESLGECLGSFMAIDAVSGQTAECEVYEHLDSDEFYSVRFEEDEILYDAIRLPF